jgi:hypothetical protein
MTESDLLGRKIRELKNWQASAWRRMADPMLTAFERREIRSRLRESEAELHRCLEMMSDRLRFRKGPVEEVGDSLAQIKFRLFA